MLAAIFWVIVAVCTIAYFGLRPKSKVNDKTIRSNRAPNNKTILTVEETPRNVSTGNNKPIKVPAIKVIFSDPPINAGCWYVFSVASSKIYKVDLEKNMCDCAMFLNRKSMYPANHAQRYCKHMFALSRRLGFCHHLESEHELLVDYFQEMELQNFSIGDFFYLTKIDDNDVLVAQKMGSDWIDVHTRKKQLSDISECSGDIARYGYCEAENRWSYGEAPFQPLKLKAYIRALPKFDTIEKNHPVRGTDFSIDAFLKLPKQNILIDKTLSSELYEMLTNATDIKKIRASLSQIGGFENIDREELALNWLSHGENIFRQNIQEADFFFGQSMKLNSNNNPHVDAINSGNSLTVNYPPHSDRAIKSLAVANEEKLDAELEEERKKRIRLSIGDAEIIPLISEKATFTGIHNLKIKNDALNIINMSTPEWYDKSKGHTYFGYAYSNFVDYLVAERNVDRRSDKVIHVINYMASQAILDGTISNNTMAKMFKYKGQIALKFNDGELALKYFQQAYAYNCKVGVKKLIARLGA